MILSKTASHLYENYAAGQPILDYHNHLSAQELYENKNYATITEFWLAYDHYKWRSMRLAGVDEALITGDAPAREKFRAWGKTVERLIGSPLYDWTAMELRELFRIDTPLSAETADDIFERANAALKEPRLRPMQILEHFNVQAVCTTNDPYDDLAWHSKLKAQGGSVRVLPSFRPDTLLRIDRPVWAEALSKLERSESMAITDFDGLKQALAHALDRFLQVGCAVADHCFEHFVFVSASEAEAERIFQAACGGAVPDGEDSAKFWSVLLPYLAGLYKKNRIVMQLRTGVLRNTNSCLFEGVGPDAGGDSIGQGADARSFARCLDHMSVAGNLPDTILFSLNPNDAPILAVLAGGFSNACTGSAVQSGTPWWFSDTGGGTRRHLELIGEQGALSSFVGMLTDSRAVGSFVRHAYFRQILCEYVGGIVDRGDYPDLEKAGQLVSDICYNNAKKFFHI